MGRQAHSRALHIWMNGQSVGVWRIPARGPMELLYNDRWVTSPEGRPLSLSLPFRFDGKPHVGQTVEAYFDNLLPDTDLIRKRLAARFGTKTDPFDLLEAVGRDCAGAVQLMPEGATPVAVDVVQGEPLDDEGVARMLRSAVNPAAPHQGDDEDLFRISLAGAQEKTALLRHENHWFLPHGTAPTTHIFKLPLGLVGNRQADMSTSVENEWLCARILAAYGLPVAHCEIARFADQKALVVTRFDRKLRPDGKSWLRLPQEDFCQVFGVPSHLKYEADGGPGLERISRVLYNSVNAREDLQTVFTAQLLFWMLAAGDGHAKNFSIRLLAGGRYELTPLYDVLSYWPIIGDGPRELSWHKAKLAMAVWGTNRHYVLGTITRRHFNTMAPVCLQEPTAEPLIIQVIERTPQVIATVQRDLSADFPGQVADRVLGGLQDAAASLAAMPAT
jgi:serine/threonine-protein kinase HipA